MVQKLHSFSLSLSFSFVIHLLYLNHADPLIQMIAEAAAAYSANLPSVWYEKVIEPGHTHEGPSTTPNGRPDDNNPSICVYLTM